MLSPSTAQTRTTSRGGSPAHSPGPQLARRRSFQDLQVPPTTPAIESARVPPGTDINPRKPDVEAGLGHESVTKLDEPQQQQPKQQD